MNIINKNIKEYKDNKKLILEKIKTSLKEDTLLKLREELGISKKELEYIIEKSGMKQTKKRYL